MISGQSIQDGIRINQDANVYVSEINTGRQLGIQPLPGRQIYLVCLEGAIDINAIPLEAGDAIKIWDETALTLAAVADSHLIMVEMPGIK